MRRVVFQLISFISKTLWPQIPNIQILGSLLFLASLVCHKSGAQTQVLANNVVPEPFEVRSAKGYFTLNETHGFIVAKEFFNSNEIVNLQQLLKLKTGIELLPSKNPAKEGVAIKFNDSIKNSEGYLLEISQTGIRFEASHKKGLFYGIQTLRQLFPLSIEGENSGSLPFVIIKDTPRFSFRALMLDPARYFLPIEDMKRYVDVMAMYKFNRLHLHLTDDHGWRIEIKKYPKLTEIGSVRKETMGDGKPHGGFYTQKALKELVAYAKERHIEIIPEIDMPGHGISILAAYPELACFPKKFELSTTPGVSKELLCAGKEEVYQFYEDVLAEVVKIFPYNILHLGGDEAPLDQWKRSPHCQAMIHNNRLGDEEGLMAYFFGRINDILIKYKKEPIFWYESNVRHYPANSSLILWRNEHPDKMLREIQTRGLKMINSHGRSAYFDYPQWKGDLPNADWMPLLTLKDTYHFDPVRGLTDEESGFIKGVEAYVWGEYVPNLERAFYMTYPRALAFSEAAWSADKNRSWNSFLSKLEKQMLLLSENGVFFRPPVEYLNTN
ncbi:beta-N-acetylhexosaminidase [Cytophaga sp. FL35]|uniref:beta-N-acetylhexosaminidase n=1 Tax=Cytophaga sp. FL35 TaxID=1904456 RepID=UPI001653857F|nr:beta-N-acetylhexosaminidase [Cytophaga sp. FL35]MBC6999837.1 beta-N-acetylhexosaminidase [Cytophaga sp. FL35]